MNSIQSAGILGAGLGTRLKAATEVKPWLSLQGRPMAERLVSLFLKNGIQSILCAFNSSSRDIPFERYPAFQIPTVKRITVDTPSSLHTLWEVASRIFPHQSTSEPVLFSMVDTLLAKEDFRQFLEFCSRLPEGESAVLCTSYIEDEKPVYVHTDADGKVSSFGSSPSATITSGMYCFSPKIYPLLKESLESGVEKMRGFLAYLVERQHPVHAYCVEKTIDVDNLQDVASAEKFLTETGTGSAT